MKRLFAAVVMVVAGAAVAEQSQVRIVDEGKLDAVGLSMSARSPDAAYPAAYATSKDDVCVAIGYTVNADGSTGNFRLLRAWSSDRSRAESDARYLDAFTMAATEAVSQRRYRAQEASPLVATAATITFEGSGTANRLADRCKVNQLADYYRVAGRHPLLALDTSRGLADSALVRVQQQEGLNDFLQFQSSRQVADASEGRSAGK